MLHQALCIISKPMVNSNWSFSQTLNSGQNLQFFCLTLKFDRWPSKSIGHLFYATSSFVHHFVAIRVPVRKHPIWLKMSNFLSFATLIFGRWPWKTIGHLFHAYSSYVHHFVAICEFKLESWSGKAQIGAKFALTSVTLTFDLWPWLFAWTSCLSMVITPDNFRMTWWQEHCEKGVTDGWTEVFLELLGRS